VAQKKGVVAQRPRLEPAMLGVKLLAGQDVKSGMILVRQRGTRSPRAPARESARKETIFLEARGKVALRTSGEAASSGVVE